MDRYKAPHKSIYDFYDKIYVECPNCNSRATISKKIVEELELKDKEILFK